MGHLVSGILKKKWDNLLCIETVSGDRYILIEPQLITLTQSGVKVRTDELTDNHWGKQVIGLCIKKEG